MRLIALWALTLGLGAHAKPLPFDLDRDALVARSKELVGTCSLALQKAASFVVYGPVARRESHNMGKFLQNQFDKAADRTAAGSSIIFRHAFEELAPTEAKHFEVVYWIGTDELYVEGKPWPVRFKPGTALIVRRGSWMVVGYMADELVERTRRWALIRMDREANRNFRHAH